MGASGRRLRELARAGLRFAPRRGARRYRPLGRRGGPGWDNLPKGVGNPRISAASDTVHNADRLVQALISGALTPPITARRPR